MHENTALISNVNPSTGLSTNYLNQFVEILLLLEMLPDMPDCIEDIEAWKPVSYEDHVEKSGLKNSASIMDAFSKTSPESRINLEQVSQRALMEIKHLCCEARGAVDREDPEALRTIANVCVEKVRPLLSDLDGVIKGSNA